MPSCGGRHFAGTILCGLARLSATSTKTTNLSLLRSVLYPPFRNTSRGEHYGKHVDSARS